MPLLAGVAAGLGDAGASVPSLALTAAAGGALALAAAAGSYRADASHETFLCLAVGFLSSGVSLGASAAAAVYRPPLAAVQQAWGADGPLEIEGTLREDAALSAFGPSLVMDVERVHLQDAADGPTASRTPGGVRLTVAGDLAAKASGEWRAGRRVRTRATLREPAVYLDPGVRDDRRALARRGITLVGSVKSAALVDVRSRGSPVGEAAAAFRAWTRKRLALDVGRWSARSAAIATAVLIGDRTGLPDADVRRLQDAGTYHVIAISGGNIAILTAIALACLRALRVPSRSSALITIGVLTFYSAIVVSAPSVERAIVAAVVYLSARVLDHRSPALNVVAVAGLLGVAAAPASLFDPGFLLSFGATLGIIVSAAARWPELHRMTVGPRRSTRRRIGGWAGGLLATTMAAEVAILPIGAWIFGRVTFAGLLLNFAAIPMMTILQAAGLTSLVLSTVSPAAAALAGFVVHVAALAIVESPRLLDLLPGLTRDVVAPPWWLLTAYYLSLIVVVSARQTAPRRHAALAFAAALALVVAGPAWSIWRGPVRCPCLRVIFLDVGQGTRP